MVWIPGTYFMLGRAALAATVVAALSVTFAKAAPVWTHDGVAVSAAANDQLKPRIISDGQGGAFITWEDRRDAPYNEIYVQRVDASGIPMWTSGGVAVTDSTGFNGSPQVVPDDNGGVIVVWFGIRAVPGSTRTFTRSVLMRQAIRCGRQTAWRFARRRARKAIPKSCQTAWEGQ